jgi:hypothetical protein
MPSFGPITTSGEGHAPLPAAEAVIHMQARVLTANYPKTELIGAMAPRGTWHVGSAGLGSFPDDVWASNPPFSMFLRFLRLEFEDWDIPALQSGLLYAPSVWWRWVPATSVQLTVFW